MQALFVAYRCVTLPTMMQGSVLPSSGIKDDVMFIFGLGLTRTLQQQVSAAHVAACAHAFCAAAYKQTASQMVRQNSTILLCSWSLPRLAQLNSTVTCHAWS